MPTSRWMRLSSTCIAWRSLRSSAPSGSSSRSALGRLTRARARATRCCWPPDSSRGRRWPRPARSTIWSISVTRRVISSRETRLRRSPKATFSNTLIWGNRAYDWNTMLTSRLFGGTSGDIRAVQPDRAQGRLLEAGDHAHRGGLAAARRAEQGEELTLADRQVELAYGGDDFPPGVKFLDDSRELDSGYRTNRVLSLDHRHPGWFGPAQGEVRSGHRGHRAIGHRQLRASLLMSLLLVGQARQ